MKIKQYRKLRGFSQNELSRRSGVSQAMISLAERGEKDLTVGRVKKLAVALGVTLEKLVEDDDEQGVIAPEPKRISDGGHSGRYSSGNHGGG